METLFNTEFFQNYFNFNSEFMTDQELMCQDIYFNFFVKNFETDIENNTMEDATILGLKVIAYKLNEICLN